MVWGGGGAGYTYLRPAKVRPAQALKRKFSLQFVINSTPVHCIWRRSGNSKAQSEMSCLKKKFMKKNFMSKNFIERIIFSKFGQKRHGWAKICQIVTYFSFLPTMTFFFPNVMFDENSLDFQLIWFFTTMTFFFGKCHFFFKNVMVGYLFKIFTCHGWKKK